jgi:tetratricopeptide (TPR) repeat protein
MPYARLLWLVLPAATAVPVPGGATGRGSPPDSVLLARADSLGRAGARERAVELLEHGRRAAETRGDRRAVGRALAAEAEQYARLGRPRDAEQRAGAGLRHAEAARDTAGMLRSLRWLAVSTGNQGRSREMARHWRRALVLGTASGDLATQGFARLGLGHHALAEGRAADAVRQFGAARPFFERLGDAQWVLWTELGLGMAHDAAGDEEHARACYRRVVREADDVHNPGLRASASNNLAVMEYGLGDPAAAAEGFRTAYRTERDSALLADRVTEGTNLAICQAELGHTRDALALLDTLLRVSRDHGFLAHQAKVSLERGAVLRRAGDRHAAVRDLREALGLTAEGPLKDHLEAATDLARVLAELDSAAAAEAVLDGVPGRWPGPGPFPHLAELDLAHGELRARTGRTTEAVPLLRRAERGFAARALERARLDALVSLGHAHLAGGERDSARVVLERAARVWERARGVMSDPEWRERFGAQSRALHEGLLRLALADPAAGPAQRAERAFDLLQRYKARTLRERMLGPAPRGIPLARADDGPAITAHGLRQGVLRDGECFIDAFVGADTTLLFALTRDSLRVAGVAGGRGGGEGRWARWHAVLASAPRRAGDAGRAAALAASARAFAGELLAPFADLLSEHGRLIVSPDGELDLVPFALLAGGRGVVAGPAEVACVPSATVFARLRERALDAADAAGILAVAADSGTAAARLRGAAAETRWLAGRFAGVETTVPGSGPGRPPAPGGLGRYDVLHFAAHTAVDDQHPWRSGVLLAPDAPGERHLRAARIAETPLAARLVVLSGCTSAGGRVLSGEGVQGLTAAFLCAGVPAVVASLWPVDDRATARLMREFYLRLERGERVGAALYGAQRALRDRAATADPFYWAAFVLVGDPDVRVPLRVRPGTRARAVAAGGAGVAVAVAAAWWLTRRRGMRGAVTGPGGGALIP